MRLARLMMVVKLPSVALRSSPVWLPAASQVKARSLAAP
jgi:hypothetical protein